jgi:ubiquinone/menaquinone biosynthesis C-methylase UbiE
LEGHGSFSLEEKVRLSWYNPRAILKEIGLHEGMVFMDIGCADGYFSILASEMVGKKGKVFALDVDSQGIARLSQKAKERNLLNIETRVGRAEDVVLCNHCADVVFYSMVLHDFVDPMQVLRNAKKMLKNSGILVNLDWKKIETPSGPTLRIRFSEAKASELIIEAGFTVEKVKDTGIFHYLITAKPK